MRRPFILALVLAAAGATTLAQTTPAQTKSAPAKPAPVDKALAPFQGTWVLTSPSGQPLAQSGELSILVTGNSYAQTVAGAVNERGTLKIDATKKPMWIDLTITEGSDAGKTQLGLIEVKGDTFTGILAFPGEATRPASFTATGNVIPFVGKKKVK